jgi:hypothetical protein
MARTILRGVTNSEEKGNRKMVMEKIFITYIQDMFSGSRARSSSKSIAHT